MKTLYRNIQEQICPPEDLKAQIFEKIERKNPKKRGKIRPLGAVAAMMVVVFLALPVMAAYAPPIEDLMYMVSPDIAARFSPIQESDEANGIRMEVVATSIHGTTAEVYLGFTDLEGKGRIEEGNTYPQDLWFSRKKLLLGVQGNAMGGAIGSMRYDSEGDTYYSMVDMDLSNYSRIKDRYLTVRESCGDKMTIIVESLSKYVEKGMKTLPVTLAPQETMVLELDENGGFSDDRFLSMGRGSNVLENPWMQQSSYTALIPGAVMQVITEEIAITGMTYLEGDLHIQVCRETRDEMAVPLYELYFEDAQGNAKGNDRSLSFDMEQDGKRREYTELIFEIPEEELDQYSLVCALSEHQTITGPWRVTFPLVESDYVGEHDEAPRTSWRKYFPSGGYGEVSWTGH